MTILFNQQCPKFDRDPALEAHDRAQPLAIESSDHFVVLTQQDGGNNQTHCILIERRDVPALIAALWKCV